MRLIIISFCEIRSKENSCFSSGSSGDPWSANFAGRFPSGHFSPALHTGLFTFAAFSANIPKGLTMNNLTAAPRLQLPVPK